MTGFENESLWFAKLGAYGQVLGAIATFSAVILSLYLAKQDKNPRISLQSAIINENGIPLIKINAVNDGKIPISMSKTFYFQTPPGTQKVDSQENRHTPPILTPGDYWEVTFSLSYLIMHAEIMGASRKMFFQSYIIFEDHAGRRYPVPLPILPEELLNEEAN